MIKNWLYSHLGSLLVTYSKQVSAVWQTLCALRNQKEPSYNLDSNPWSPVDGEVVIVRALPASNAVSCVSLEALFPRKINLKKGQAGSPPHPKAQFSALL